MINNFVVYCAVFDMDRNMHMNKSWLSPKQTHALIWNIFSKVNKFDVIIFVRFLDFACTMLSVLCCYFRNKDRPLERCRRGSDRESEGDRWWVCMCTSQPSPRLHMNLFVFLLFSCIFEQSYVLVRTQSSLSLQQKIKNSDFSHNIVSDLISHALLVTFPVRAEEAPYMLKLYDDFFQFVF